MPRSAIAPSTVDDELSMSRVDDLIQRGRSQGHLSLSELRTAFEEAGLTPAEGRSILRELSEAGVQLANEVTEKTAPGQTVRKSIGRPSLLTAEQEVDLAKRIEAGLFAEHKLETASGLSADLRRDLEL